MAETAPPYSILFVVLCIFAATPFAVAIHEGGHALAARLTGQPVVALVVGHGPRRTKLWIGSLLLVWRQQPFSGYVLLDPRPAASVWVLRFIWCGGSLANLTVAGLAGFAGVVSFPFVSGLSFGLLLLAVMQIKIAVSALIPHAYSQRGMRSGTSDGRMIANSFKSGATRIQHWSQWLSSIELDYGNREPNVFAHGDVEFLTDMLHALSTGTIHEFLLKIAKSGTEVLGLRTSVELYTIDMMVTKGLTGTLPIDAGQMDLLTARAMQIGAENRSIRQTRASVLVEHGRHADAKILFASTSDKPNTPFEEGMYRFFLMKAELGLGNRVAAESHFAALRAVEEAAQLQTLVGKASALLGNRLAADY